MGFVSQLSVCRLPGHAEWEVEALLVVSACHCYQLKLLQGDLGWFMVEYGQMFMPITIAVLLCSL